MGHPQRLPARPTRLIGREDELKAVEASLLESDVRLLTLTGPPGVGKTRLAVEAAAQLTEAFEEAVFVDLSPVRDSSLVLGLVVQALGIRLDDPDPGESAVPLALRAGEALRDRRILLILDNFEQVVPAAPDVAALLAAASGVKVVATSRIPLHLQWEREFDVTPLAVPEPGASGDPASLARYPSLALFVERARAAKRAFSLHPADIPVLAEICRRLDGLPLAIELCAGLTKTFPLRELLGRLEHALDALTTGSQDLPPRHRSLREAIGWSYTLLSSEEQDMLLTTAVFSGSCSLEGLQAVHTTGERESIPRLLNALVDKSLVQVRAAAHGARYQTLESIKDFCLEQGAPSALHERRRGHADYYLRLTEEGCVHVSDSAQLLWLDRLDGELENVRSAVRWAFDNGAADVALRIATALVKFCTVRDHLRDARGWLEEGLAAPGLTHVMRARALAGLGEVIWRSGEASRGDLYAEAYDLSGKAEDAKTLALALRGLAITKAEEGDRAGARPLFVQSFELLSSRGEYAEAGRTLFQHGNWVDVPDGSYALARSKFEESLRLARKAGDRISASAALYGLSRAALFMEDYDQADRVLKERLALVEELQYPVELIITLNALAASTNWQGRYAEAVAYAERSCATARSIGSLAFLAEGLEQLAETSEADGQDRAAAAHYAEALQIRRVLGLRRHTARSLKTAVAIVAGVSGDEMGAKLLGAAETVAPEPPRHAQPRRMHERRIQGIMTRLGQGRFEAARNSGHALSLDQAVEIALSVLTAPIGAASGTHAPTPPAPLSHREREVAALVSQGLSNRVIAQRLFIGERTVDTHVQHIMNKLGVSSRVLIAAWAVEQGLPAAPSPN